jgi:4'-phosphopantetheinyl transferase
MSVAATTLYPVLIPVPEDTQALKGRDKVAALSRLAREALTQSCEKSGLKLDGYPKGENGAPIPVDGVHWSVSHKAGIVGGVAAPLPIGLDLETIRPVSDGMMAKVAGDAEWRQVAGDRQRIFFRFWTAKEAVLKAAGIGITGLAHCRVVERIDDTHMTLTYAGRRWPVSHFWVGRHVAAITSYTFDLNWTVTP